MTKHTPTPPWKITGSYGHRDILEGDRVVAENVEVNRAARIVRAVNAYDSYKRFKDFVLEYFPGVKDNPFIQGELDAISKSEGK